MTTPSTDGLPTPQWAADVRPGDTLMLSFDRIMSAEQAAELSRRAAEILPDVRVVIVDGCSSMVVQRADATATEEVA